MGVERTKMRRLLSEWRDHFAIIKIRACLTPPQPTWMRVKHERKDISERRKSAYGNPKGNMGAA
jgi:hypothetical protein